MTGSLQDINGDYHGVVRTGTMPMADIAALLPPGFSFASEGNTRVLINDDRTVACSGVLNGHESVLVLSYDSEGNGLPDWWEIMFFGHTGVDPSADPDNDGLSNLQEYQQGSDPSDFYNGHTPLLTKTSGDDQDGYASSSSTAVPAALAPLIVQIVDANTGSPFAGATVDFTSQGSFGIEIASQANPGANWQQGLTLQTDSTGHVSVWVKMPAAVPPVDPRIQVTSGKGAQVQFVIHVPDGLDSDGNGLADAWEMMHFRSLGHDPGGDDDNDGLSNAEEMIEGTDPNNPDTDGDGVLDGLDAVATDRDITFPRYPVPVAYAVIDLKDFVPTGLNNHGQACGYWDDGTVYDPIHDVWGAPCIYSAGEVYSLNVELPNHHFQPDATGESLGPIDDEYLGNLSGIDDQGNVYFDDYVNLRELDGIADPFFACHAHFNGSGFDEIVIINGDDFKNQQGTYRATAGGAVLTGSVRYFSWNATSHHQVWRMSVGGGLQDANDAVITIEGQQYDNTSGWDDLVSDDEAYVINDTGYSVGAFIDGYGTGSPEQLTHPLLNNEFKRRLFVWGDPTPKVLAEGFNLPTITGISNLKIITGVTEDFGATVWLGSSDWKKKALPLAPGQHASDVFPGVLNKHGQMICSSTANGACLWQNTRLFPLDRLASGSGYKNITASQINDSGMIIGAATHVSSGPDDPIPAGERNVLLVPVTVLRHQKDINGNASGTLESATNLKVGQWEDAWRIGAPNSLTGDFPEEDADRFYVQIPKFAPPEQMALQFKTTDSIGITIDGYSSVQLHDAAGEPDVLTTEAQLMVADLPDKNAQGAGTYTETLRKKTHRISIFGKLNIKLAYADATSTIDLRIPGQGEGKIVRVSAIILRDTPGGAAPFTEAEVWADLRGYVDSAFAQANITVIGTVATVDPSSDMDLRNGVELAEPGYIPASIKHLLNQVGTPSPEDIGIFYVRSIRQGTPSNPTAGGKAYSLVDSAFPSVQDKPYTYNCFVGREFKNVLTTAHELGHLLTNDGRHIENIIGYEQEQELYIFSTT